VVVEWASIWMRLHDCIGTRNWLVPFSRMPKKPVSNRNCSGAHERFLIKAHANGEKVRESIVKGPRKKRYPDRPYWHWTFDKTKKKGFCKLALKTLDLISPALLLARIPEIESVKYPSETPG
jgi:hypothetical protein